MRPDYTVEHLHPQCKRALLRKVEHHSYQHVYVSPHFDDAVFSCGGIIIRQRRNDERVLVITVCSGVMQAPALPTTQGRSAASSLQVFEDVSLRRNEDQLAMQALGVDHLWLGERDAVVRHRRYRSLIGATSRPLRQDSSLVRRLVTATAGIDLAPGARLYFPLAVGNHVDHQLAFAAGATLAAAPQPRWRVAFYEDSPYVLVPHLLRQRLQRLRAGWPHRTAAAAVGATLMRRTSETTSAILRLPLVSRQITAALRLPLAAYVLAGHAGLTPGVHRPWPRRLGRRPSRLTAETHDVSATHQEKLAAVACYRTQVAAIMGTVAELDRGLRRYAYAVSNGAASSVERLWHPMVPEQ